MLGQWSKQTNRSQFTALTLEKALHFERRVSLAHERRSRRYSRTTSHDINIKLDNFGFPNYLERANFKIEI